MRNLKHLFTALLIICCTTALAETVAIDGITYKTVEKAKTAFVIAGETNYSGNIIIPETIVHNDVTYSITSIGDWAFSCCYGLTSITIPNSITTIGDYAFQYCELTSITIPNNVTSIGNHAFRDCRKLKNLSIGNNVTTIGDYAFHNCDELTSVTIPNSVTSIGNYAFRYCRGLKSLTLGNGITSVGYEAFSACLGLTTVKIPHSLTVIGYEMFSYCTNLTSVTIGDNVEYIYQGAFCGCSNLTKITIPNSVIRIDKEAFSDCSALKSVTIGSNIQSIYEEAFSKCSNITDVYCLATTVPSTNTDAFNESYPEYMTLHVPTEAINNYKTTEPWNRFGAIVTLDSEEVEIPKCATPVISYENGKLSITCETVGAEFVTKIDGSDITTHYDSEIELTATYEITTYAMLLDHEDSDVATATLCWIECGLIEDGTTTDIINIKSTPVLIRCNAGVVTLSGMKAETYIAIYDTNGTELGNTTATGDEVTVITSLAKGDIAVVNIGGKAVKAIMQ